MITWTARTRWDPLPPRLSRPRRFTRSRLTRTAMPWPTSRTGCVSRPPRAGCRPRRCVALRARRPPARTTVAKLSSRGAGTMLPEILPYDPTRPASFPENGRALTDDAVDAFLSILTNGKVTRDKIGPHGDLLAELPYLGPPHNG